jgi:hypothetical protein
LGAIAGAFGKTLATGSADELRSTRSGAGNSGMLRVCAFGAAKDSMLENLV